jgi:hypothetical protein
MGRRETPQPQLEGRMRVPKLSAYRIRADKNNLTANRGKTINTSNCLPFVNQDRQKSRDHG